MIMIGSVMIIIMKVCVLATRKKKTFSFPIRNGNLSRKCLLYVLLAHGMPRCRAAALCKCTSSGWEYRDFFYIFFFFTATENKWEGSLDAFQFIDLPQDNSNSKQSLPGLLLESPSDGDFTNFPSFCSRISLFLLC